MAQDYNPGEYFAVYWKGRGRKQECLLTAGYATLAEAKAEIRRLRVRTYTIKRRALDGVGTGRDGYDYISR